MTPAGLTAQLVSAGFSVGDREARQKIAPPAVVIQLDMVALLLTKLVTGIARSTSLTKTSRPTVMRMKSWPQRMASSLYLPLKRDPKRPAACPLATMVGSPTSTPRYASPPWMPTPAAPAGSNPTRVHPPLAIVMSQYTENGATLPAGPSTSIW